MNYARQNFQFQLAIIVFSGSFLILNFGLMAIFAYKLDSPEMAKKPSLFLKIFSLELQLLTKVILIPFLTILCFVFRN